MRVVRLVHVLEFGKKRRHGSLAAQSARYIDTLRNSTIQRVATGTEVLLTIEEPSGPSSAGGGSMTNEGYVLRLDSDFRFRGSVELEAAGGAATGS